MAIVSYDEKPGIQAIAATAPDLPPKPGVHVSFARDYEYKRHGTLSLLAGIDLLTGKVHALVRDRHRFIGVNPQGCQVDISVVRPAMTGRAVLHSLSR